MFSLPPMQSLDGMHPLVVHFPVALLLVVPVLIVLGLVLKDKSKGFYISGLVLMFLGTISCFFAIKSGEEAGELIERTPGIAATLEAHEHLAESTAIFFIVATLVYLAILLVPVFYKKGFKRSIVTLVQVIFLAGYSFGCLMIANTAHLGGKMVYGYGVKGMLKFDGINPADVLGNPAPSAPSDTTAVTPPVQNESNETNEGSNK